MKLTATKAVRYGGNDYQPGDEFEASERDGKILKAVGKATDHVAAEPPAPSTYKTRRLKARD